MFHTISNPSMLGPRVDLGPRIVTRPKVNTTTTRCSGKERTPIPGQNGMAISSALMTRSVCWHASIDQPTMRRLDAFKTAVP